MDDDVTGRNFTITGWGGKNFAEAAQDYERHVIEKARTAGALPHDPEAARKAKEYDALIASGALAALGINP